MSESRTPRGATSGLRGRRGCAAEAGRDLDAVEADLALARGRIIHTRYLHQLDTAPPGPRRILVSWRCSSARPQGRRDDALTILAEAGDLATASGARRILGSVAEAQSAIGG